MAAEARRRYTFEALRALTIAASARRPIVFAVEDLHWIDPASQDFLGTSPRTARERPCSSWSLTARATRLRGRLLVLLADRAGAPVGGRERACRGIGAQGPVLARDGQGPDLPEGGGQTLLLEEITRSFVDTGILARADGGYVLARPVTPQDVPDTVQGVIMARIDRLADTRKRTIQTAAVIGREFGAHLLGRIANVEGGLDESLADLRALEFIYEKALFPDLEYVFKHALVQDVAYGSLLKPWRRALHELVGRAIEALYAERLDEHVPSSPITSRMARCGRRRSRTRDARGTAPGRSSPTGRRSTSTPRCSRPRPR